MSDAYFRPVGPSRFASDPATGGPWDTRFQHGGPPSALLVACAEQAAAEASGRDDLVALRYAAEFAGPVPVAEVEVTTTIARLARSAVLVDAELSSGGRVCLHARIWLLVADPTPDIAAVTTPVPDPLPDTALPTGATFPYLETIEWRRVRGSMLRKAGPATYWTLPRRCVLPGLERTGLQTAVLVGDSSSGLSSELDWDTWSFQNVDLDVHLARPMSGDWLHVDAVTQLGPTASGLATSTLSDETGRLGVTAQTLLVVPRGPAA